MGTELSIVLTLLALLLLAYAGLLRTRSRRRRKHAQIPDGHVVYSDLSEPARPLYSARLQLSGKPDYVLKREGTVVPVEVKSGRQRAPHRNHVLQLAAYCQLLEEATGQFVPHGILVYESGRFTVPYDPQLRFALEGTLQQMRRVLRTGQVERNHSDERRCAHCSMREHCTDMVA